MRMRIPSLAQDLTSLNLTCTQATNSLFKVLPNICNPIGTFVDTFYDLDTHFQFTRGLFVSDQRRRKNSATLDEEYRHIESTYQHKVA